MPSPPRPASSTRAATTTGGPSPRRSGRYFRYGPRTRRWHASSRRCGTGNSAGKPNAGGTPPRRCPRPNAPRHAPRWTRLSPGGSATRSMTQRSRRSSTTTLAERRNPGSTDCSPRGHESQWGHFVGSRRGGGHPHGLPTPCAYPGSPSTAVRSPRLQIVQGRNHGEWLFDGIHQSYAVVLLAASPQVLGRIQIGVARSPKDIAAMSDDTIVTFTPADLAALPELKRTSSRGSTSQEIVGCSTLMRNGPRLAGPEGWIRATHDARWDFAVVDRTKPW